MISVFKDAKDAKQAAVAIAVLAVAPLVLVEPGSTYQARLLVLVLVFSIIAMALNIVFAHTDQLFLFVGALTGISAYATILLADSLGVSPWLTIVGGVALAALAGLIVSYVAARLEMSIIVIAILTLSLQLGVQEFFQGARDITGGTTGFPFTGLEVGLFETLGFTSQGGNYYVLLVLLAGSFILYSRLIRSKYGLAFDAIRQDEVAAESIGINVIRYKLVAGVTGAALIGLVGPLYANSEGWVTPSLFAFAQIDVFVLIILVLGGLRTMLGPVVGAVAIIYINEYLREFGQWRTALYGLMLMGLFLYFKQGVVPELESLYGHERVKAARGRIRNLLG
jgi:branched-chain amino acid transport system permease protein